METIGDDLDRMRRDATVSVINMHVERIGYLRSWEQFS